jgi:acyl-CoA synthetase (NDP forming)
MPFEGLDSLFSPKSIAIIGASADTSKFTGRTLKYLIKHGYKGKIYPVNPKYSQLMGISCYSSVRDLPEPVDNAFVQIPNASVVDVVKECAVKGVRAAVIHTAGLAESSEIGKQRQLEIKNIARSSGMRICGPNSAGLVNVLEHVALTPVVALELDQLTPGRIGFVSQSGGLMGSLLTRAEARGIGFSYLVSTGNEADLDASDYIEFMLEDSHTDVVIVFLEGFRNIERFLKVADLSLQKGKPIIILKVGRSETGAKAATSHTGSLTGSDEVYDAIFKQKGIVRVRGLEDLFEAASLFSKFKPHGGNRIGIVTTTGGVAMLIADECSTYGFQFPKPSRKTLEIIAKGLPSFASFSNPLDVTMSGIGIGYGKAINLFLQDENFDIVMAVVGTSSQFAPEMGVEPILERKRESDKTVVAFLNPNAEEALRLLEKNGIPTFRTPESCARVLKNFLDHGRYLKKNKLDKLKGGPGEVKFDSGVSTYAKTILNSSSTILNEFESKRLLSLFGIHVANERMVSSIEEALDAARQIGYPIAVKLVSKNLPHKTEAEVVQLWIRNDDELKVSFENIIQKGREYRSDVKIDGILVQEMVQMRTEVIVGMSQDSEFGPTLLFGVGGIFVELFKDISIRVAPIKRSDAEEMIDEVKASSILKGFRGRGKLDIEGIIDVLLRLSQLSIFLKDEIREIDINPLMVMGNGKGVKAVDALIIKKNRDVGNEKE